MGYKFKRQKPYDYVLHPYDAELGALINECIVKLDGKGSILVKPGDYAVTTPVLPTVNTTDIRLIGYGAHLDCDAVASHVFDFDDSKTHAKVRLEGFEIDGNSGGGGGINIEGAWKIRLAELQIHHTTTADKSGIRIKPASTGSMADIVRNSIYNVLGYAIHVDDYGKMIHINDNWINTAQYNGISINGAVSGILVSGNHVNATGHSGIALSPGCLGSIVNNHVTNVSTVNEAGIEVEHKHSHHVDNSYKVKVSGNKIDTCNVGILFADQDFGTGDALSPYDLMATYNDIKDATHGIKLDGVTDVQLKCNNLDNCTNKITFANSTGLLIKDNPGYVDEDQGNQANVADGGTISHNLTGLTPSVAIVTPSVAGEMVTITNRGTTTITVAIKKHDGTPGTTQTLYYYVRANFP